MTFAPILPAEGIVGFRLLEQTEAAQRTIFDRQPQITRDVQYFRENIASVATAQDLVSDRQLLRVALGAFGLDEQINSGAFLRKILEDGTDDPLSLANRLVDTRFQRFAETFGFGNSGGAQTAEIGFAEQITTAFTDRQFEIAVGEQDNSLRLALNFRREIAEYANASDPVDTAFFQIIGDLPVRTVLEGALGLDTQSFGQLDIDRQQGILKDLTRREFGAASAAVFQDSEVVTRVIERFLARQQALNGPSASTPGFTALSLLSANTGGLGSVGIQNIVLSGIQSFRPSGF